jgi:hypothetical protein
MSTKKNLLITISDDHRSSMEDVAEKLRAQGVDVSGVLKSAGVISGSWDQQDVANLKSIAGVQAIEEEPIFHTM